MEYLDYFGNAYADPPAIGAHQPVSDAPPPVDGEDDTVVTGTVEIRRHAGGGVEIRLVFEDDVVLLG